MLFDVAEFDEASNSRASANAEAANADSDTDSPINSKSRSTASKTDTYHRLEYRRPRRPAVARLHRRCSGPEYRDRSKSSWPRSHGSPGAIGNLHRAHTANPAATEGATKRRAF